MHKSLKLLIAPILGLYNIATTFACEPPNQWWNIRDNAEALREMRDFALKEYDRAGDEGANEAQDIFRRTLKENPKEWIVNSGDGCECVTIIRSTGASSMTLQDDDERCFPEYHFKFNKDNAIAVHFNQGALDKASAVAEDLTEAYPDYWKGLLWQGLIEQKRGNSEAALKYFTSVREVSRHNPIGALALAFYYSSRGAGDGAEKDMAYEEAAKLSSSAKLSDSEEVRYLESAFAAWGIKYIDVDP